MGRAGWFDEVMRFYDRFLKGDDADRRRPADRRPDQRRHVALGGAVAAGRRAATTPRRCAPAATPTTPQSAATGASERLDRDTRASGRSPSRCRTTCTSPARARSTVNVDDDAAQRQPRRRRLRPRRERHRPAHHPAGPPGAQHRRVHDPARPVVGRLEARGRPPHRRARDRQQQDWWACAAPSAQTVTVSGGSVTLPFLRYRRTQTIQGDPGVQLDELPAVHRHGARWRAQRLGDRLHAAAGAGGRPGGVGVHRRLRRRALSPTGRAGSRACASRPA